MRRHSVAVVASAGPVATAITYQAVEWSPNGQVVRLPAGPSQGFGFAINDAGTVVGADFATSPQAWLAPAYWSGGQVHDMAMSGDILFGIARGSSQRGWAAGGVARGERPLRAGGRRLCDRHGRGRDPVAVPGRASKEFRMW